MKHLHLITGLLISFAVAGCGDYGDDGAVNSTGTDDDTGSTDFTLAVAVPTFGAGSGGKPRLRTESEAPVAHAVTGSAAYTELARGDVRAFVIVADSGNASGYREVPIDVVEFENLGNGRYRIAIDGQAQVDGFFAISINGVVFKIPLSRTGSTDAPIDVNALQAALADRLQALLVANDVCSAVTVDQLNTLLDAGRTYVDGLTVPDDINDVAALIEFYRVSVASFLRERVDALCAPALNSEAILALVGDYHSLDSGLYAGYDADDLPVLESHSTLKASKSLVLDETNPALATFSGYDTYDDRFAVTFGGEAGAYSVFQDLSVQNPERDPGIDNLSFAAFAGDANRVVVKYGDVAKTTYINAGVFVPGFVVTLTPAWQQFAHDGTLFGASQSTTTVFDLSQATATCLAAVGLTTAALTDSEEFFRLAGLALQQPGEDALGKALLANCGPGAPLGYGVSLHVDTPRTTNFGITEMTGRFAVVSLEPELVSGSDAVSSGVGGLASDGVFDIDDEGVLQAVNAAGVITQFSLESTLLAAGDSPLSGQRDINNNDDDLTRIEVPLDLSQNPATTGELQLEITDGNRVETYNGFASASRDLFAFDLATTEQGSSIGSGLGGLFMVGDVSGFTSDLLAIQGNYVYAASSTADTLQIVDVSNPAQMQEQGTYTPPQSVILDVSVAGDYAYLALDGNGLDVVTIQDPQDPQQATRYAPQQISNIGFAQVSGNYLVAVETVVPVNASSSILHVIDVSTPTAPALQDSFALSTLNGALNDPAESVSSLVVAGNRVYTTSLIQSTSVWIIRIFDISVSQGVATLTPLGQRSLGAINYGARDIKVAGNTAYVALGYDGLAIFDVTDPAQIGDGGDLSLQGGGAIQSLWVNGTTLNVVYDNSEGPSGIAMIDVGDPLAPAELGDIQLSSVDDIVGAGNYVYVGTNTPEAGLLSVNVASAPIESRVASVQQTYYSQDIVASGNYLYAIGSGLEIFDLTNPQLPAAAGSVGLTNAGMAVAVSGNRAYIASYDGGLFVADISDPQQPTLLPAMALALGPAGSGIAVAGNYAYVTDQSSGLQIVNISGTSSTLAQTVQTSGNANAVAISGNYAFVAASGALDAFDISSPGTATPADSDTTISNLVAIAISGNYAYVADNSDRNIAVVDISDPTDINVVNHIAAWTYADRLVISGTTLYALDGAEISVIDISDPLNAAGVAHIDRETMDVIGGFAVVGQYLYEGDVLPNEDSVLNVHNLPVAVNYTKAIAGVAIGVRIDQEPPAAADLVGKQFTLTGQQAAQSSDQTEAAAGLGIVAGGSLRFVQVGTDVLPVFDLPLSSVVIADFSGVTPRLAVQFDQWTPSAVAVNANGRVSFTLTDAASDTSVSFAGYLGDNGLLVGRFDSLTLAAGAEPVTVDPQVTRYPGLAEATGGIFVGVPRQLPLLP